MCQVYYLRETERDFLFIIVMSPRVGNTMAFMCGEKKQNERPYFHACVFFFFFMRYDYKFEQGENVWQRIQ